MISVKKVSVLKGGFLFVVLSVFFLVYLDGMQKKKLGEKALKKTFLELSQQRQALLEEQEELRLQIESQNDMEWKKMTLMKEMGVVPEGKIKVYFEKQEEVERP